MLPLVAVFKKGLTCGVAFTDLIALVQPIDVTLDLSPTCVTRTSAATHLGSASVGACMSALVRVPTDTLKHRVQAYLHHDIFDAVRLLFRPTDACCPRNLQALGPYQIIMCPVKVSRPAACNLLSKGTSWHCPF